MFALKMYSNKMLTCASSGLHSGCCFVPFNAIQIHAEFFLLGSSLYYMPPVAQHRQQLMQMSETRDQVKQVKPGIRRKTAPAQSLVQGELILAFHMPCLPSVASHLG